jgi:hypothetical protein
MLWRGLGFYFIPIAKNNLEEKSAMGKIAAVYMKIYGIS